MNYYLHLIHYEDSDGIRAFCNKHNIPYLYNACIPEDIALLLKLTFPRAEIGVVPDRTNEI